MSYCHSLTRFSLNWLLNNQFSATASLESGLYLCCPALLGQRQIMKIYISKNLKHYGKKFYSCKKSFSKKKVSCTSWPKFYVLYIIIWVFITIWAVSGIQMSQSVKYMREKNYDPILFLLLTFCRFWNNQKIGLCHWSLSTPPETSVTYQKIKGFLMFSWSTERDKWYEMGYRYHFLHTM